MSITTRSDVPPQIMRLCQWGFRSCDGRRCQHLVYPRSRGGATPGRLSVAVREVYPRTRGRNRAVTTYSVHVRGLSRVCGGAAPIAFTAPFSTVYLRARGGGRRGGKSGSGGNRSIPAHTGGSSSASGRVAIVYQGYSDFKNSFAAGTFTDVPVRYMGKPQWVRDAEKAAKASK